MNATKTKKAEKTRTAKRVRPEPLWNVILHNDWENLVTRVVWVLVRVIPGTTIKQATKVVWQAHTKGRAVAKTCHRELTELYEERLRERGLTVSAEQG